MKSLLVLLLVAVVASAQPLNPPTEYAADVSYTQGGRDWTGTCQTGHRQSPIDLDLNNLTHVSFDDAKGANAKLEFHYFPVSSCAQNISLVHAGHTLKVKGDFGYVTSGCCERARFFVKQFHFHAPSEHTIDGTPAAMEMHIVHEKEQRTGQDDFLVVSILFRLKHTPGSNPFLADIGMNHAPHTYGEMHPIQGCLDLNKLSDTFWGDYYAYEGSLTTPPCDELAQFRIMAKSQGISQPELDTINQLFMNNQAFAGGHGNNRAVQPLNGREVLYVKHVLPKAATN